MLIHTTKLPKGSRKRSKYAVQQRVAGKEITVGNSQKGVESSEAVYIPLLIN